MALPLKIINLCEFDVVEMIHGSEAKHINVLS